ncbi:Pheophorbide a oxygenase chloroplastic [Euphorbia peplus]|nr:Pheophorbide a oxygenase chloroplastic [Euphorbia peplus]
MEALRGSIVASLNILPRTPTTLQPHHSLKFQFYSTPNSFVLTTHKHKSRFNVLPVSSSSSSSSSSYAVSTEPTELSEDTKFDWMSQWYPVMPECDLDKRVPHAKTIMGLDVVVWWDRNDNSWKVFDDTCPHRLAPLSQGRIDQWGRLQCVYHGWCFSGSGDCKFIPQAPPDGPPVHTSKKACVAAYPTTLQNGIVWFWPNSNPEYKDILLKKKPPYFFELDDPSYIKPMAVRDFPFGYEILIENLVDPAHVPYAHFNIRTLCSSTVVLDREGGAPLDINIEKIDINGFRSNRFGGNSKFMAPCTYYSAFTLPSKDKSSNATPRRGLLVFFCIPVGPGKSRLIFTFPRNFAVWFDRIIPRWVFHFSQNLVLDSDLYLLHLEERKIMEVGASNWQNACFVPTKSDAQVIAFRKWLKKYSDGQINWGWKFTGALPPTPPKDQLMDRYWSHVVNCSSCRRAYKGLKIVEVVLQVMSIVSIGILAATKQSLTSVITRSTVLVLAVVCFAASRWLAHFIYKNYHFHDYSHALV